MPAAHRPRPIADAAHRLHNAEVALHDAHQSHVDNWVAVASERLHGAVVDYLNELAIDHAMHRSES